MQIILTSPGKKRIRWGHPWIFKSDLQEHRKIPAGIVELYDLQKKFLGQAFYSPHSEIALRWITSKKESLDREFWREKLMAAKRLRESMEIPSNAYRVVFGESDGIPSFILDKYDHAYVFQTLSAGLEAMRDLLLEEVKSIFAPVLLVERNDVSVRTLERLPLTAQVVAGEGNTRVEIEEAGLLFEVDLLEGQKTGAFLDQRDNRILAGKLAEKKEKVLDIFSYQGWFACHLAMSAGEVTAVEQSEKACAHIQENAQRNNLKINVLAANAFDVLRSMADQKQSFDLINLDPPAFAKSRKQIGQALKGYKEINLRALKLLKKEGILISSSCSHHLSLNELMSVVHEAALDAKREIQVLRIGTQSADHPVKLGFPESNYLKCLFLRVL